MSKIENLLSPEQSFMYRNFLLRRSVLGIVGVM